MAVLRTVLTIILILVSIVFTAIVLMQEGKSAGLGAISGAAAVSYTHLLEWEDLWLLYIQKTNFQNRISLIN